MNYKYSSLAIVLSVVLSGCGSLPSIDEVVPDNTQKYRKAETMPPLDVPPDLSTSRINDDIAGNQESTATYSEFKEAKSNPLASKYNITPDVKPSLEGEGDARHLIVPSDRDVTWQNALDFWYEKSITVERKDERIGLMDTEVGADDYAYRLKVERGETSKQTLVYVGTAGSENNSQKNEAMLRQLAEFLGGLHQEAKAEEKMQQQSDPSVAAVNATLVDEDGDNKSLLVDQDFSQVWKSVGRILDSKGFAVEERDRSRGIYFVHYLDPFDGAEQEEEGLLSKLAFWKDDAEKTPEEYYYIKLISDAADTKIVILDAEETRTSSDTAKRLLSLIQEQLVK